MARTAPAPNIPPIPGMCPSIAVMGGGGGGGGGSGDGSGDGDGSGGPGGEGNGENANGDSRGAGEGGSCGGSGSSSCGTHDPSSTAGDPVDVATGRVFTTPVVDLHLNGPLPLRFARLYSSAARKRDVGLGHGWVHSFAWEVEERRESVMVHLANGTRTAFPRLEMNAEAVGREGMLLRRTPSGYLVDAQDGTYRLFEPSRRDPDRARLAQVVDPNGNAHTLGYDDRDRLITITDAVGRQVRLVRTAEGRVASLEVYHAPEQRWVRFAAYVVDDDNHLVLVEDAVGARSRFTYDEHHLLTRHERSTGLVFRYVYDDSSRCIETWGERADGGTDPAFGPETSKVLADGSKAKGLHHVKLTFLQDGHRELVTVRAVSRFRANDHGKMDKGAVGGSVTSRTFDDLGFETRVENAVGAVWQYVRDNRGRQLRVIDPLGNTTSFTRDAAGRTSEIHYPNGGITRYSRDERGNVLVSTDAEGGVESFRYDERGRIVSHTNQDGRVVAYRWDHLGNLVEARYPNGVYRYEFDYFGRRTASINPKGERFEYAWSLRNEILRKLDPLGHVSTFEYDGERRITRVIRADGSTFETVYGGLDARVATIKPDGRTVRFVYDLDEKPLAVHNENGQEYRFEWSALGLVTAEHRWDGHVTRYRYDALGQTTRITTSTGDRIDFEYDLAGRVTTKTFRDGQAHEIAYDVMGEKIRATSPGAEVQFERNLLGGVVREIQTIDGEPIEVRTHYRPGGAQASTVTSTGYGLEYKSSAFAYEVFAGDNQVLSLELDAIGAEVAMHLPGGAVVHNEYDALARPTRRTVSRGGPPKLRPDEPAWVGRGSGDTELRYGYSAISTLTEVYDSNDAASRSYRYDRADRLVSLERSAERLDLGYDQSTNVIPPGGASYATGDVLTKWKSWEIETDAEGRVVQKRDPATGQGWRYTWAATGMLASVEGSDGTVTSFLYDAFGRRLKKVVTPNGRAAEATTTRFIWDQNRLLQELQSGGGARQTAGRKGREYLFFKTNLTPLAHAEVGADGEKTWFYYLADSAGTPDVVLDASGGVAEQLTPTPWGREAPKGATPLRKQGEYFDEETGLVYNHYRYLDQETGRFLSPDPIGLEGGLNLYVSGPNQVGFIDPFGLSAESDRTAAMRENAEGSGWGNTTAVARLENGDTIATNNSGSLNPATAHRDPSMNNSRGTAGTADGGVRRSEWVPHAPVDTTTGPRGTGDIENCHHAERRAIQEARRRRTRIKSISATANCCPTCRQALRRHNPNVEITDPNGEPAPDP